MLLLRTFTSASPVVISSDPKPNPAHDTSDPANAGVVHCFRSGDWMAKDYARKLMDQCVPVNRVDPVSSTDMVRHSACGGDTIAAGYVLDLRVGRGQQFFEQSLNGCLYDINEDDPRKNTLNCAFIEPWAMAMANITTVGRATREACVFGINQTIERCEGENDDTRGGWWQFDDDGTTYGLDPLEEGTLYPPTAQPGADSEEDPGFIV